MVSIVAANACDTDLMRQPYGTGEIIEIEVIDADPGAFEGPGSGTTPRPPRPRPRWLAPVAVVAAAALATVVVVWQPWQQPPVWRTFDAPAPTVASLGNHLLPATPPGPLATTTEPDSTVGVNIPSAAIGVVFAEPEASYGSRRWALFEATTTGAGDAPPATGTEEYTVHGLPASLSHLRVRNEAEWGPLGGFNWRTDSNLLSKEEALAFAAAVGVQQGQAAIRRSYDLTTLQPLGTVSAFHSAFALEDALTGGHFATAVEATVVQYTADTGEAVQVASVPAPPDALALVEFVFGSGAAATVHGLPAVVLTSRDLGNMVIWLEGGRLIAATGGRIPETEMFALAESVRPVTDDEWATATQPVFDVDAVDFVVTDAAAQVDVGGGITATGVPWRASITPGNPMLTCVYTGDGNAAACTFSTPLTPSARSFPGSTADTIFVVAVLPIDEVDLVLHITDVNGEVFDIEPVAVNDQLSAVTAEIPATTTFDLVDRTS